MYRNVKASSVTLIIPLLLFFKILTNAYSSKSVLNAYA